MVTPPLPPPGPDQSIRLLIGTSNAHKLEEIARLLADEGADLALLEVVGVDLLPPAPPPVEDGSTFEANAIIKASSFAHRAAKLPPAERPAWVLADDSGLCVQALDGAPGIYSARYAGPDASDEANNVKLLAELDGVTERDAEFVCVIACGPVPDGPDATFTPRFTVEGRCQGHITATPYGGGGFGYDPLFYVPSEGATFAELTPERKNELSHRGRALRAFGQRLREALQDPPGVA